MSSPTIARRAGSPAALEVAPAEDDVTRSAAIVQASGYRLIPLLHAVGPWQILAVCSQGLLLVGVVRGEWPATLGVVYGFPPTFPVNTRRLIHRWTDKALPEALSL